MATELSRNIGGVSDLQCNELHILYWYEARPHNGDIILVPLRAPPIKVNGNLFGT